MKRIYIVILLLALLVILIACQPDAFTQASQNTQQYVGSGCGV